LWRECDNYGDYKQLEHIKTRITGQHNYTLHTGAENMKNAEMKVEGNILTITVDLSKEFGPSSSGKTIIIASTEGNISVPGAEDKKVGLNVYRKK